MRKIYLFLTLVLLLIGSGNLWAEDVAQVISRYGQTTNYENILDAWNAWLNSTNNRSTLKLLTNQSLDYGGGYWGVDGQSTPIRTLDLNGNNLTITSSGDRVIWLYYGAKLTIKDSSESANGTLLCKTTYSGGYTHMAVCVGYGNYADGLVIESGKLACESQSTTHAFYGVYTNPQSKGSFTMNGGSIEVKGGKTNGAVFNSYKFNMNGGSIKSGAFCVVDNAGGNVDISNGALECTETLIVENGGTTNITGNTTLSSSIVDESAIRVYGTDSDVENYSILSIGENVNVNVPNGWCMGILGKNNAAYGVHVNIDGSVISKNGITINGGINKTEGNVPVINIGDNAVITGGCGDNAAIYAAGYGIWNIGAATLNAATPIYAKSGVINIDGATIEACGAKAYPQPNNNGFYNTGDAIVMDTNKSYAGAVLLNIYGDATITSTNGYAIQEVITNGTTSSAAGIAISGDNTVLEGAAGSLQMTENFKDAMKDGSSETYQWVLNGIAGGVYSKVPGVVADGYVAQEVEIGGKKYYKVVVADPEAPAPASQTTYIVNDTEWDYSVEYKNSSALVITTGNTLKVKGVNVNRTSSEDVSKVTVEAGAKLIVGAEGIQTNSANGLLLKSDAVHGMGMLLYDGSTTATSPYGTAELYLFSKKIADDNYIWQHFGIPTVATPSIEKNVTISVNKWDVKKGWIWDGGSSVLTDAWTGFNIATNHEEAGSIVKFGGQLIGNGDATLVLDKYGYNALANSYTAPVNLKSVIDAVFDASTDGSVWIYSAKEALETGIKQFHSFGSDTPEDESLNPMQAFFVLHESDASDNATISYEDAVLDYNTRAAVANDYNKATLKITGGGEADEFTIYEGEQFSSSIDKGYDIKQMNHDFIQIYAVQNGENYASVATDDAENLEITIKTKAATQYTLSFSGISEGYGVKLTDVKSGAEIEVGNDKTYTFTADANTTAVRFRFGKSEVSAEEANADAVKIWSANGSLFVEGNAAEADIEIINLSGVKVASAKASGEAVQAVSISNLASGVYVVRVGNTAAKIVK